MVLGGSIWNRTNRTYISAQSLTKLSTFFSDCHDPEKLSQLTSLTFGAGLFSEICYLLSMSFFQKTTGKIKNKIKIKNPQNGKSYAVESVSVSTHIEWRLNSTNKHLRQTPNCITFMVHQLQVRYAKGKVCVHINFVFSGTAFMTCCCVCLWMLTFQLNSPMNSVSSTEDIKPPLGLNGVMKVPAQPSGTALSLTKHICAICGDRSSGKLL